MSALPTKADVRCDERDVRFVPILLKKVFLGRRTKILRAADAFYARRREGPYRFIQNRSRTSVVALKCDAAAEKPKDQLSRDFLGRSIFDFCNNICQKATSGRDRHTAAQRDGKRDQQCR